MCSYIWRNCELSCMLTLRVELGRQGREIAYYVISRRFGPHSHSKRRLIYGHSKVMMKLDPTTQSTEEHCLQWTPKIIPEKRKQKFAKEISQKKIEMKTGEYQPNSGVVNTISITVKSMLQLSLVSLVLETFFLHFKENGFNTGACPEITSVSYQENKSKASSKSKNM